MNNNNNNTPINRDENFMPKKIYETRKRMHFVMYRGQSLTFWPALMTLFGLNARQTPSKARDEDMYNWSSAEVCEINRGINYLMVYCDLLEHVPLGNTNAPLLRIVDATGAHGDIIHRTFDEPRFIPVKKKKFDSIEFDIRDDLGLPIAFESGKKLYCCDRSRGMYEDYYARQSGSGGPVYQGSQGQKGHGLGSMLSRLFRSAMPMIKRSLAFFGKHALKSGWTLRLTLSSVVRFVIQQVGKYQRV